MQVILYALAAFLFALLLYAIAAVPFAALTWALTQTRYGNEPL